MEFIFIIGGVIILLMILNLRGRVQKLEELIKIRGRELEEAEKRMSELTGERDAIRTKVDSLLGLLQDIAVPE